MQSRTAEGKHTKRFIVEYKLGNRWLRSNNTEISGFFATREEADAAIKTFGSLSLQYRVRQK